jgi:hypothetical protein
VKTGTSTPGTIVFEVRMTVLDGDAYEHLTDNCLTLSGVFKGKIDIISFSILNYPFKEGYYEKNHSNISLTGSHFNYLDCRMYPSTNITCTNTSGNPGNIR